MPKQLVTDRKTTAYSVGDVTMLTLRRGRALREAMDDTMSL